MEINVPLAQMVARATIVETQEDHSWCEPGMIYLSPIQVQYFVSDWGLTQSEAEWSIVLHEAGHLRDPLCWTEPYSGAIQILACEERAWVIAEELLSDCLSMGFIKEMRKNAFPLIREVCLSSYRLAVEAERRRSEENLL